MNDLTIIHLSDLHIDNNGKSYSNLLKALLRDLKEQVDTFSSGYFVLIITGDIINMGEIKAISNAKKFFSDLKKYIGERLSAIYIVPGNHDKKRTDTNKFLIPAYRSFIENRVNYYTEKETKEKIGFGDAFYNNMWVKQKETYDESGYIELIDYIYFDLFPSFQEIGKVVKDTFGVHVLEMEGKKYCFVLYNTAWSCIDDIDNRHIILGDFQLRRIKEKFDELTDEEDIALTLAMGHHPLSSLYGSEQDRVFHQLIFREDIRAQAYLCGHTHDRNIINWSNTNHTMYTLMTGIGWPDKDETSAHYHYYSIYNFNLDLNSMEILVRSTRDTAFLPDLSIYGGDGSVDRLFRAIKPNLQQSAIAISTATCIGQKVLFPSASITKSSVGIAQALSDVRTAAYSELMDHFLDLLVYGEFPLESEDTEEEPLEVLYYDRYKDVISDVEGVKNPVNGLRMFLKNKNNKTRIYCNFEGYFQNLCQVIRDLLLPETNQSTIRFHFRYLSDKSTYMYSELCSSFASQDYSGQSKMDDIKYGDLLEGAFNHELSKSLVYEANKALCEQKLDNNDIWKNFITTAPDFSENVYHRKVSKNKYKNYPYITFGVTIDNHDYDALLYLLDYYRMDIILSDILKTYVRCFDIDMDEFCNYICKRG